MKTRPLFAVAMVATLLVTAPDSQAEAPVSQPGGGSPEIVWDAGISGVSLVFDADGDLNRLISTHRQPVNIPDQRGIRSAQVIAEERAKAAIVRFIREDVSSERIITQVQSDVNSSRFVNGTGGESLSEETSRQMLETVVELTRSVASGTLSGVVVLEQGYDADLREAWVTVGISEKSRAAAGAADDWLKNEPKSVVTPEQTEDAGKIEPKESGSRVLKNKGDW